MWILKTVRDTDLVKKRGTFMLKFQVWKLDGFRDIYKFAAL